MNNIEETLWNYIDGNCTADEQKAISTLIAQDEVYRLKYNELLKLNSEFSSMELDEPSMAFTYNVIEGIRTEHAQIPLKATINKRIIMGIAIFFVFTLLALLVFMLANIQLPAATVPDNVIASVKIPDFGKYITKPIVEGFVFFDVLLALFLFGTFLRTKNFQREV
jgi:hypothetical protein